MTEHLSRAVRLFGTEQEVAPARVLKAGPLGAELEAGNLRYIRFGGVEIIRAVSFIVRDRDWGTYDPDIADLEVEESADRFTVRYKASVADETQSFAYEAQIVGEAGGRLRFSAQGLARTDFLTNRTGFVILHPIEGVAGERVEIEHVDGRTVSGSFPALIDPVQPMMELRRLTHWAGDGALEVSCLMEGDTFEMEDQRNWTDASYKTYVRPLALPWPYTLPEGERIEQAVSLTVEGEAPDSDAGAPLQVSLGEEAGTMPPLGLGLAPEDLEQAEALRDEIGRIGARHLVCHHDPRRGHDGDSLSAQVAIARAIGAQPWLEAVIVSVEDFAGEIAALGRTVEALGSPFEVVLLSPAPDLKCTLPGSPWPPAPPADAMFAAAREAFGSARLGGGMFSYFTELNRKRPPVQRLDLVSFTTSALVHAGDDRSVMETLQALPAIAASAEAIAGERPYAVGPSAIGMRDNPYGEAPKENPDGIRQAMNRDDPRQRGLLGAAWALGYFARFAYGGASAIALGAPVGAFGALSAHPSPGAGGEVVFHPVFHVLKGLARLSGAPLRHLRSSRSADLLGLAAVTDEGTEVWLANLTGAPIAIKPDFPVRALARLDAAQVPQARGDPTLLDRPEPFEQSELTLDAYGVLRILAG